jgi:hypothetical protein
VLRIKKRSRDVIDPFFASNFGGLKENLFVGGIDRVSTGNIAVGGPKPTNGLREERRRSEPGGNSSKIVGIAHAIIVDQMNREVVRKGERRGESRRGRSRTSNLKIGRMKSNGGRDRNERIIKKKKGKKKAVQTRGPRRRKRRRNVEKGMRVRGKLKKIKLVFNFRPAF